MRREYQLRIPVIALWLIATVAVGTALAGDEWNQPLHPVSTECAKIGPGMEPKCQDELEVWGIGMHKDGEEKAQANALLDARRAACWCALYGGDGMLKTSEQRKCFESLADEFYTEGTVNQFVPWVSDVLERRKLEKKGKKVKLKVRVNVDHCLIRTWLEDRGCPVTVWNPASIIVIPDVARGANPIEMLESDADARMAKTVIENFLTVEGDYELLEPDATLTLDEIQKATDLIEDNADDYVYRLALMLGADIYIRFETMWETPVHHGQQMQKTIVRLDAYETTTARKLASQTAYSEVRPQATSKKAMVEEAISSGTRDILNRIQTHWIKELERGVQYLAIMVLTDDADEDEAIDIQDCFIDCVEDIAKASQSDVMTTQRIKYRVWVDMAEIDGAAKLDRALRNWFKENCSDWKLREGRQMGKFVSRKIKPAE